MPYKLLLLCLLLSTNAFSQNAFYDAVFCGSMRLEDVRNLDNTISSVTPGDAVILREFESFLDKPFTANKPDFARVKSIFNKINAADASVPNARGFMGLGAVGALAPIFNMSKLSGSQVDTLLYGLTIYFEEQFRRAYIQTYLSGIEKTIGKSGELKLLFPASYEKIRTFDPTRYKELGNEMKNVFKDDLSSVLDHLRSHIRTPDESLNCKILSKEYCDFLRQEPIYPMLDISSEIGNKLIKGMHPSDIMGELDQQYYQLKNSVDVNTRFNSSIGDAEKYVQFGKAMHLLNIFQRNLRDTSAIQKDQFGNAWVNFEKLNLLNNSRGKIYFMALLYQEDKDFFDAEVATLITNWSELKATQVSLPFDQKIIDNAYIQIKNGKITKLLTALTELDEFVKLKKTNLLDEDNFLIFMKGCLSILQLGLEGSFQPEEIKKINTLSLSVFQIYNSIRLKNYSNIPLQLNSILASVPFINNPSKLTLRADLVNSLIDEAKKQNNNTVEAKKIVNNSLKNTNIYSRPLKGNTELMAGIVKYMLDPNKDTILLTSTVIGVLRNQKVNYSKAYDDLFQKIDRLSGFSSGVINAKTTDDIKAVITNYASPPSSYIDKRQSSFSITAGGLPGLFIARESLVSNIENNQTPDLADSIAIKSVGTNFGLSLPVGIDISFGIGKKKVNGASMGVFLQAIDLGAMLNYRIKSQSSTLPDKVGFKNVLSPGAFITFGFPKSPLTLNFGYQYAPALRKITIEAGKQKLANSHRLQLSVAYDIPLFKLYVRERK